MLAKLSARCQIGPAQRIWAWASPGIPVIVEAVRPWVAGSAGLRRQSPRRLDHERVNLGSRTFGRTVALERTVPFGAIGALGRHQPRGHLRGLFGCRIELGHLLAVVEEQARDNITAGVDHDKETRRGAVRSLRMRSR